MRKIRVLVVDDAVVVRRLLTDVLSADPQLEVVGAAASGRLALAKIEQLQPDVVTLDVEMPDMDGLQTLGALRKTHKRLPVIMFSGLTERGARAALDALALGANDYVTKPNAGSLTEAMACVREQLVPKIKAFCGAAAGIPSSLPAAQSPLANATRTRPLEAQRRVEVLAIGVSTGGPNALDALFAALPALPVPIVVVQHMPPVFTRLLAERLTTRARQSVREGSDGGVVEPGTAWIAPGDHHMTIRREQASVRVRLNQDAPENSCRPAVDVLLRSTVEVYGAGTLAVIMTGMGQDGLRGCERVCAAGGQVLAQDAASSVVWGMPGAVVRAGLADQVVPLSEMAGAIVRRVQEGRQGLGARSTAGVA